MTVKLFPLAVPIPSWAVHWYTPASEDTTLSNTSSKVVEEEELEILKRIWGTSCTNDPPSLLQDTDREFEIDLTSQ